LLLLSILRPLKPFRRSAVPPFRPSAIPPFRLVAELSHMAEREQVEASAVPPFFYFERIITLSYPIP